MSIKTTYSSVIQSRLESDLQLLAMGGMARGSVHALVHMNAESKLEFTIIYYVTISKI